MGHAMCVAESLSSLDWLFEAPGKFTTFYDYKHGSRVKGHQGHLKDPRWPPRLLCCRLRCFRSRGAGQKSRERGMSAAVLRCFVGGIALRHAGVSLLGFLVGAL